MLAGACKFRDSSNRRAGVNLKEGDHDLADYFARSQFAEQRLRRAMIRKLPSVASEPGLERAPRCCVSLPDEGNGRIWGQEVIVTGMLRRICLMASAMGLIVFAWPAPAQLWGSLSGKPRPHMAAKKPTVIVLCLPPGGTRPVPCSTAAAGSTLQLDTDLRGSAPLRVTLISVSGVGRASVQARPVPGRDGSYLITVPRHLCGKDKLGNFEIQIATSDMNQAEGKGHDADSIGYFQMMC